MRCYSISLSKTIIVIVSVIVLFVVASADDENPASLSSWGLSSIINNDNNNKDAPNEDSVIVAPANSDFIIADTPPSCSANQKQKNKVRRQLSCKLEDRKSTAPTGQVEPGQEGNDPNINKNPKEAAGTQITPVDYADFIRDRDLCPVAYVGFQRIFAVCDHGSLMSRVILHDIVVLFDVTPVPFRLGCPGTSTQWCCHDVDYWSNHRNPLQGLAEDLLRETNLFFQQLPAQRPGMMWGSDCLAAPGPGL